MISTETIVQLRSQLADFPDAITALDTIADCEGDLIDAAIVLAIRCGQEPQIDNSQWLHSLAKKYRARICRSDLRNDFADGKLVGIFQSLLELNVCPRLLILPVLLQVRELGIDAFCAPIDPP
jgi:hypothetical protein